ncbi:MAG: aryl-sulfate sulfotransferase, partial [Candidatus Heimdallarchaeaceae archaeon]
DMEGNIIIEKDIGADAFMGVEFINSTTILWGNYIGAFLWNIETDKTEQLYFKGHHEYEKNYANNTYFTFNAYFLEHEGMEYAYDQVQEFTAEGKKVWYVNTSDFIPFSQWCPFQDLEYEGKADVTHANSLVYDEDYDVIYFNCRNTNTFYKIDHKTGNLLWSLGEYGDFTLRDYYGKIKDSLFYHAHAIEKVSENTFILFDNDEHNQTNNLNHRSRIIEITIDEKSMTANVTWQYTAPKDYHSAWWGDADRLPNMNRLGTFGTHGHEGNTKIGARLVEVNNEGDIVWQMYFPKQGEVAGGVYQMERVSFSPNIVVNNSYWIKSGEKTELIWDAFYNFRNKHTTYGTYKVYFQQNLVDNGSLIFKKYWQPTVQTTDLGYLKDGEYNVTFILSDESGHTTNKTINLVVSKNPPETEKTSFFGNFTFLTLLFIIVIRKVRNKKRILSAKNR